MPDIPSDIGQVAKEIGSLTVTSPADLRYLSELLRVLHIQVAEVTGYAEFEVSEALRHLDMGSRRRAKQVTRPLKHAVSLDLMAAKRCVMVYRLFLKAFAEELSRAKSAGGHAKRSFSWKD
jgi:hypothetical protein